MEDENLDAEFELAEALFQRITNEKEVIVVTKEINMEEVIIKEQEVEDIPTINGGFYKVAAVENHSIDFGGTEVRIISATYFYKFLKDTPKNSKRCEWLIHNPKIISGGVTLQLKGIFSLGFKDLNVPFSLDNSMEYYGTMSSWTSSTVAFDKKYVDELFAKEKSKSVVLNTRIAEVKALAEEIYPGNWDFSACNARDHQSGGISKYRLTILFPEITITNSKNESHTLYDLYVSFYFRENMDGTSYMYGFRGTYTIAEMCSSYNHSHLPNFTNGGSFCVGGGTEFAFLLGQMSVNKYDLKSLKQALILLNYYVGWESLEGGPYKRMASISEGGSSIVSSLSTVEEARVSQEIMMAKIYNLTFTEGEENDFKVSFSKEHINEVLRIRPELKVIKLSDGSYISNTVGPNGIEERARLKLQSEIRDRPEITRFKFKGEYVVPSLKVADVKKGETQAEVTIHENVLNTLSESIQGTINYYYLNFGNL